MMQAYPTPGLRRLITVSIMATSLMNSLDLTIANVALPHIQGSVSASADQITWVLTSYIVAAAIMTPLSGWLANRFGRKRLIVISTIGFTLASALCGVATSLEELVLFRLLQGCFGAPMVPLSQAILLDINPPEQHGPAMSIWGMGALIGPVVGPALGGYLTENFDWRWVFFINVPVGMLALTGLLLFLPESRSEETSRFDVFGFSLLALGLAATQVMLDRGQQLDWFSSWEICIEAVLAATFMYLFVIHMLTAKRPFIEVALFRDRNFVASSVIGFFLGAIIFSVLALLPPMLEGLMGYPVVLTGMVTAPRGVGTMIAMVVAGRLVPYVDARILVAVGLLTAAFSMSLMAEFSLAMNENLVLISGFIQGIGTGLVFVPLSTMAFASLDQKLRNEGAAMYTLMRSIGSAVGISVLQAMTIRTGAVAHSRLVENIRPDNKVLHNAMPDLDFSAVGSLAQLNEEISRQASMVSYVDSFRFLFVMSIVVVPLVLLLRPPRRNVEVPALHID